MPSPAAPLAWLGRRVLPSRDDGHEQHAALAVLVGGVIMLLLYVVPFIGFIAYKAFDILGLGIESMSLNPDTVVDTWLRLAKVSG